MISLNEILNGSLDEIIDPLIANYEAQKITDLNNHEQFFAKIYL